MSTGNDWNRRREIRRKLQPTMAEHQRAWHQANTRATQILRHYDKTEFRKKYDTTITNALSKIMYADISVVISAIAETVKSIKPDETVDNNRQVTERLMRKAMWATTSSIRYFFAKRREFPPDEIQPQVIRFPSSAAKNLTENLNKIVLGMTAQDSAIFLGKLSGIYFKTCPKELLNVWMERKNDPFSSLFTISTLEGELLMSIDF